MHIDGFKQLGVNVNEEYGYITCESNKLKGTDITLDFPSVGATENIMLASCLAEGTTYIRNVAREPEIKDLQDFLNGMGAKVKGAGSNTIVITGVKELKDVRHKVIADRNSPIVTATYERYKSQSWTTLGSWSNSIEKATKNLFCDARKKMHL